MLAQGAWMVLLPFLGAGNIRAGADGWTNIGPQGSDIRALSVDPHNPRTLYAATNISGAFKSMDGGASWTNSNARNTSLVFDPQDENTIYAIDGINLAPYGISKSTDGGATWSPSNTGLAAGHVQSRALAIDPTNHRTLYEGGFDGIFKSTDGGANWSPANFGLTVENSHDPRFPEGIYPYASALVIDRQTPSIFMRLSITSTLRERWCSRAPMEAEGGTPVAQVCLRAASCWR